MSKIATEYESFMESDISENYKKIVESFKLLIKAKIVSQDKTKVSEGEKQAAKLIIDRCQEYIK